MDELERWATKQYCLRQLGSADKRDLRRKKNGTATKDITQNRGRCVELQSAGTNEEGQETPAKTEENEKMTRIAKHILKPEERNRLSIEAALAGKVICDLCGATLETYAETCTADLSERCPGFEAIENAAK